MSQQVKLGFVRDPSVPDNPIKLRTLQIADGKLGTSGPVFIFAEEDQNVTNHADLMELPAVKKALAGIQEKRNPFITLKKPLSDRYLDEDLNPMFGGKMKKRKDLNDLVKKFSLKPFDGKGDGQIFMRTFEDECKKYDVCE